MLRNNRKKISGFSKLLRGSSSQTLKKTLTKTHLLARGYSVMAAKCLTEEDIENIFNDSSNDYDDGAVSDCSET